MAIPDYADPRSHQFFSNYYVGSSHGDNGASHRWDWDSSADGAEPTLVLPNDKCAYCGNRALPIQAGLRRGRVGYHDDRDYSVTGYTCCCKGAMDEVEHRAKVRELEDRHSQEMAALAKQAPKPDPKVFQAFIEGSAKYMAGRAMERFGREKNIAGLAAEISRLTDM